MVMSGMWAGGSYCSLPAFDLETFCQMSSEMKVTDLHLVPPVALLLATSPVAQKYDLASLERIVISAAPLKVRWPMEITEKLRKLRKHEMLTVCLFRNLFNFCSKNAFPVRVLFKVSATGPILDDTLLKFKQRLRAD